MTDVHDLVWQDYGACREIGTEVFFPDYDNPQPSEIAAAKAICALCIVTKQCLDLALATEAKGIWAGTSEKQRRAMVKKSSVKDLRAQL